MAKVIATLEEATALFEKGSFGRAESACRRLLRRDKESTSALFLMALIHQEQKKTDAAIAAYRKLIEIKSDIPEAYYNLGILLSNSGVFAEAIQCQKKALKLKPDWEDAWNNLGKVYLDQRELEQAIACFEKVIELNELNPVAWLNYGNCLLKGVPLNVASESLEIFQKASELNPDSGQAQQNLGLILETLDRKDEAIKLFQRAVELETDKKMWRYFLDVRLGTASADGLPPEYVTGLFDSYADDFDDHLVKNLEYNTPAKLYDVFIKKVDPERIDAGLHILDLGCGTGLSGVLFEKHKQSMVGIDLSKKMIEVAREKEIYDELIIGDMHQVMDDRPSSFDLILSVDVFVYVGDLNRTFEVAASSLKPNGYFVFSVEKHDGEGFQLAKTNRFQHAQSYLQELIEKYKFQSLQIEEHTLRKEGGLDMTGYVVVLQKL